jgi:hypothetical protein
MDTLIQLRQPQLSRKPDESALSHAPTEALPPLQRELLGDVADALNQLDEDREQLEELQKLAGAVEQFDDRYRIYAAVASRRQARELRQAQTEYDNASRDRNDALAGLALAKEEENRAKNLSEKAESALAGYRISLETLQAHPTMQDANRLDQAKEELTR